MSSLNLFKRKFGTCDKCGTDLEQVYAYKQMHFCKSCLILDRDFEKSKNIEKKKDDWEELFLE
jgi:late competence protein required for DNA uptake (superfamily II DNA/RNA helicase)